MLFRNVSGLHLKFDNPENHILEGHECNVIIMDFYSDFMTTVLSVKVELSSYTTIGKFSKS